MFQKIDGANLTSFSGPNCGIPIELDTGIRGTLDIGVIGYSDCSGCPTRPSPTRVERRGPGVGKEGQYTRTSVSLQLTRLGGVRDEDETRASWISEGMEMSD